MYIKAKKGELVVLDIGDNKVNIMFSKPFSFNVADVLDSVKPEGGFIEHLESYLLASNVVEYIHVTTYNN